MENRNTNILTVSMLAEEISQHRIPRGFNWTEATCNFELDRTSDIIAEISDDVIRERFIKYIVNLYKLFTLKNVSTTYTSVVYNDSNKWRNDLLEWVQIKIENKEDSDFFSQNQTSANKRGKQIDVEEPKENYGLPLKVRLAMLQKQETKLGMKDWSPKEKADYYSNITGCSPNKIYNLISGPYDLTEDHHSESVEKANALLQKMGIKRPIIIDRKSKKSEKAK